VVFVASLLLLAVTIRVFVGGTYVYAGVAFHVDPGDARQEAALRVAVGMLKTAMDKNVCLSCPHSGTALRCIVWNDGRVWLNPVVTVRSEHTTEGYETPFNAGASERRLVKRAAWLTVMHDGDTEERVVDGEAHCLEACLELFDGKELPPL
jgi:hypothetical protein